MRRRKGPGVPAPRAVSALLIVLLDGLPPPPFDDGLDRFPGGIPQQPRGIGNRAAMRLIAAIDEQANQIPARAMHVVRVSTFAGINQAGMVDTGEIDHAIVVDIAGVHVSPSVGYRRRGNGCPAASFSLSPS